MNSAHACLFPSNTHIQARDGQYVHKKTHHRDADFLYS